jgi:hypothetical protein
MDSSFAIIPVFDVPPTLVINYWQRLIDSDLLRYRLCDVENPTIDDAKGLMSHNGVSMFMVWDHILKDLRAEFALTNFTGKAAMVHFSMHPDNEPQRSMHYARTVTDIVLNEWGEKDNPSAPFLYALYGLTPVTNRAACAFVQRVGFKKTGILPMGQRQNGNSYVDAMITIKERKNGREGVERQQ